MGSSEQIKPGSDELIEDSSPEQKNQDGQNQNASQENVKLEKITKKFYDKENFFGSLMIATEDEEGNERLYAIRTREDGTLEGNEIGLGPDGTRQWTQRLSQGDFDKLEKSGIIADYTRTKEFNKAEGLRETEIWITRLMGGDDKVTEINLKEANRMLGGLSAAEKVALAENFYNYHAQQNLSGIVSFINSQTFFKLEDSDFKNKVNELENNRRKAAGYND